MPDYATIGSKSVNVLLSKAGNMNFTEAEKLEDEGL